MSGIGKYPRFLHGKLIGYNAKVTNVKSYEVDMGARMISFVIQEYTSMRLF